MGLRPPLAAGSTFGDVEFRVVRAVSGVGSVLGPVLEKPDYGCERVSFSVRTAQCFLGRSCPGCTANGLVGRWIPILSRQTQTCRNSIVSTLSLIHI